MQQPRYQLAGLYLRKYYVYALININHDATLSATVQALTEDNRYNSTLT